MKRIDKLNKLISELSPLNEGWKTKIADITKLEEVVVNISKWKHFMSQLNHLTKDAIDIEIRACDSAMALSLELKSDVGTLFICIGWLFLFKNNRTVEEFNQLSKDKKIQDLRDALSAADSTLWRNLHILNEDI